MPRQPRSTTPSLAEQLKAAKANINKWQQIADHLQKAVDLMNGAAPTAVHREREQRDPETNLPTRRMQNWPGVLEQAMKDLGRPATLAEITRQVNHIVGNALWRMKQAGRVTSDGPEHSQQQTFYLKTQ